MNTLIYRARCPKCGEHLVLGLDFYWSLICECGYVETLEIEGKEVKDEE